MNSKASFSFSSGAWTALLALLWLWPAGCATGPSFSRSKARAEQGDAKAQDELSVRYFKGRGTPQDYSEALKWALKAAEQGYASGEYHVGVLYLQGQGVPNDLALAASWLGKAAGQGFAKAQYALGVMYQRGQGVPQDFAQALKWYRKAAEQQMPEAQGNLGYLYSHGQGVPRDKAEAVRWYRKAAEQGLARAQYNLAIAYDRTRQEENTDRWASRPPVPAVPPDDKEMFKWLSRAAAQGLPEAQTDLGTVYADGQGRRQDYLAAVTWYRRAADQGHPLGQYALGTKYEEGKGVPQDQVEALKWYQLAAEGGCAEAVARREDLARRLTREQVAEADRRAAGFVPRKAAAPAAK